MADRTFVEWDKDDLDALGMLKIDVLALGMLSAIRRSFDLIAAHHGKNFELATVPAEDSNVYDMLCRAEAIGVFQVESRAQMNMLPRLKPRDFYDLVIEVAIVRPGPIQGDMVHPYLRRRNGEETVSFPSQELEDVLGKTLGVPLFQEQAMRIAVIAAGFTPAEADRLRRAMATFRKSGIIHEFGMRLIEGMVARGYTQNFAERCFRQIEGFGEYGFPESHAASFALLVYVSAWLKCYYPAAFCAALINSQPMGFYAPAQLVREAQRQGVHVLPVCINRSDSEADLERHEDEIALRLGFNQISGLAWPIMRRWLPRGVLAGRLTVLPIVPSAPGLARARWNVWRGQMRLPVLDCRGGRLCGRCARWHRKAARRRCLYLPIAGLTYCRPKTNTLRHCPPCRRAWKCWKIMPACDCRSRRIPCRFCAKICTRATFGLCRLWTPQAMVGALALPVW